MTVSSTRTHRPAAHKPRDGVLHAPTTSTSVLRRRRRGRTAPSKPARACLCARRQRVVRLRLSHRALGVASWQWAAVAPQRPRPPCSCRSTPSPWRASRPTVMPRMECWSAPTVCGAESSCYLPMPARLCFTSRPQPLRAPRPAGAPTTLPPRRGEQRATTTTWWASHPLRHPAMRRSCFPPPHPSRRVRLHPRRTWALTQTRRGAHRRWQPPTCLPRRLVGRRRLRPRRGSSLCGAAPPAMTHHLVRRRRHGNAEQAVPRRWSRCLACRRCGSTSWRWT